MIYVKINGGEYPAQITGMLRDRSWDDRDSKTITLTMSYATAVELFVDGAAWSIVQRDTAAKMTEDGLAVVDASGNPVMEERVQEWDNSEYSVAGAITDNRDGTVSVKMGKPTEAELASRTVTALVGGNITPQRAAELRPIIETAAVSLPDADAAKAVTGRRRNLPSLSRAGPTTSARPSNPATAAATRTQTACCAPTKSARVRATRRRRIIART